MDGFLRVTSSFFATFVHLFITLLDCYPFFLLAEGFGSGLDKHVLNRVSKILFLSLGNHFLLCEGYHSTVT